MLEHYHHLPTCTRISSLVSTFSTPAVLYRPRWSSRSCVRIYIIFTSANMQFRAAIIFGLSLALVQAAPVSESRFAHPHTHVSLLISLPPPHQRPCARSTRLTHACTQGPWGCLGRARGTSGQHRCRASPNRRGCGRRARGNCRQRRHWAARRGCLVGTAREGGTLAVGRVFGVIYCWIRGEGEDVHLTRNVYFGRGRRRWIFVCKRNELVRWCAREIPDCS